MFCNLFLILLPTTILAQIPVSQTMKACYAQTGKRFCTPVDQLSTLTVTSPGVTYGYCCDDASTNQFCTDGNGSVECTLTKDVMPKTLFMSYWVGMTPDKCGVYS
jgi:hypothetical protein